LSAERNVTNTDHRGVVTTSESVKEETRIFYVFPWVESIAGEVSPFLSRSRPFYLLEFDNIF